MAEEEVSAISGMMQTVMSEEIRRYSEEHPDIKKRYEASNASKLRDLTN